MEAGENKLLKIDLQEIGSQTVKLESKEKNRQYIYPLRTIGWILAGVTIISGGFSFYYHNQANEFKNEADKIYDEYKSLPPGTSEITFNEKYRNYENKLDLANKSLQIRNILLGISGINTGISLYCFLYKKRVNNMVVRFNFSSGKVVIKYVYLFE